MKRRKKGRHFKTWANRRQETSRQRTLELEPEDLADYVRQAEKEVLPIIKDMQLGPGVAQLVLALHTQMLVTGDPRMTPESMMAAGNSILALWQEGYYTPGPEYPFTLAETLRDVQAAPKAKADYAEAFQPFVSTDGDVPLGLGTVHGGHRQTSRDEALADLDDRGWAMRVHRCLPRSSESTTQPRNDHHHKQKKRERGGEYRSL
jgi:hypothetical protein